MDRSQLKKLSSQTQSFTIEGPCFDKGQVCEPILRSLPAWFGIEEAIVQYVADIDHLPTFLACEAGEVIGFLSIKQHYLTSAEVLVMGIRPDSHRQGMGRTLLHQAQVWLKDQGVEYLQVKTVGPSCSDANYAKTRAFYQAMGFTPLEELLKLWDENNPCLILVKRL
jgi:N-acetylglutamate synthase-like GNAT family acetyltransferase